jgi:hypothetical protein
VAPSRAARLDRLRLLLLSASALAGEQLETARLLLLVVVQLVVATGNAVAELVRAVRGV